MSVTLGEYDGQPITETKVRLVKAGDGLSAAMSLDPEFLHIGTVVDLVVRATVTSATLRPVDDADPEGALVQIATLSAAPAAMTESEVVASILAKTREDVERAKGNVTLPGLSVDDETVDAEVVGV